MAKRKKLENLSNFKEIIEYATKADVMGAAKKYGISYDRLRYYMKTHDIKVEHGYYFKNKDVINDLVRKVNQTNLVRTAVELGVSKQTVHQKLMKAGFSLMYVRRQDVKDLPYMEGGINE